MSEWLSEIAAAPPPEDGGGPPKDEMGCDDARPDKPECPAVAVEPPPSSSSVEISDTSGEALFWFDLKLPIIDIRNPPPPLIGEAAVVGMPAACAEAVDS